jgi:hypothetical protein
MRVIAQIFLVATFWLLNLSLASLYLWAMEYGSLDAYGLSYL